MFLSTSFVPTLKLLISKRNTSAFKNHNQLCVHDSIEVLGRSLCKVDSLKGNSLHWMSQKSVRRLCTFTNWVLKLLSSLKLQIFNLFSIQPIIRLKSLKEKLPEDLNFLPLKWKDLKRISEVSKFTWQLNSQKLGNFIKVCGLSIYQANFVTNFDIRKLQIFFRKSFLTSFLNFLPAQPPLSLARGKYC